MICQICMCPFTSIDLVEMTGKYLTVLRYTYQFQAPVKGKGGMTGQRSYLEVSLYMLLYTRWSILHMIKVGDII